MTTEPELPELPKVALLLAQALTDYVKIEGLPYSNDVRQALAHAARPTGPTFADVVREIQQTGARIADAFQQIARLRTEQQIPAGQPLLGAILDEIPIDATHPPIDDPELRRRVVMNLDDTPPHGIPRPGL